MIRKFKNLIKPRLKLAKGTRVVSLLFIAVSIAVAAGILFAANMYYNIDTGEVITEEIQRITNTLRATGGAIIGGSASQNPTSGYDFEVVGKSRLATTTIAAGPLELIQANQLLKFTGGTSYYVGFKANTGLSTTTEYIWPTSTPPSTAYYLTVDPNTGQMGWDVPQGAGDISAVGDVSSGNAFTAAGTGSTLWFHSGSIGALTVDSLTANATYTLPNISGLNYLTLTSGGLGSGGVLFADNGLIATSSNLQWDNASRIFTIGSTGKEGQLRIYSQHANGYYLGFIATSTMTTSTVYYWPTDYGSNNYVLTTDGNGRLYWQNATGTGAVAVSGTPSANQITYWADGSSITGENDFQWDPDSNTLSLAAGSIIESTNGSITIQTTSSGDIILDPASGKISLSSDDWIETSQGYQIGKSGTLILKEMIPIFGFDLPAQTASTSYVKISRTLENYPFTAPASGTDRVHKFIIRYADNVPTASTTNWRVATTTGAAFSSFTVPGCGSTTTTGCTYITTTTIPTDGTDWWLEVQPQTSDLGREIRVYQIFLASYDQIK